MVAVDILIGVIGGIIGLSWGIRLRYSYLERLAEKQRQSLFDAWQELRRLRVANAELQGSVFLLAAAEESFFRATHIPTLFQWILALQRCEDLTRALESVDPNADVLDDEVACRNETFAAEMIIEGSSLYSGYRYDADKGVLVWAQK